MHSHAPGILIHAPRRRRGPRIELRIYLVGFCHAGAAGSRRSCGSGGSRSPAARSTPRRSPSVRKSPCASLPCAARSATATASRWSRTAPATRSISICRTWSAASRQRNGGQVPLHPVPGDRHAACSAKKTRGRHRPDRQYRRHPPARGPGPRQGLQRQAPQDPLPQRHRNPVHLPRGHRFPDPRQILRARCRPARRGYRHQAGAPIPLRRARRPSARLRRHAGGHRPGGGLALHFLPARRGGKIADRVCHGQIPARHAGRPRHAAQRQGRHRGRGPHRSSPSRAPMSISPSTPASR